MTEMSDHPDHDAPASSRFIIAGQPILTGLLVLLRGMLEVIDIAFPASTIPFDLILGLPSCSCRC